MKYGLGFSIWLATASALFGQTATSSTPATAADSPMWLTPSTEINKGLPSWLTFSGQYRARFEGYSGGGYAPNTTDDYLLSQLQLNLLIHPLSWFKLFTQGFDARSIEKSPAIPPYQTTWNLRMAYLELGDVENQLFGLRVGRQELTYGDQRLIGNSPWTNAMRTFDAVRGTVRYKGYRLDVFASTVVNEVTGTPWDHHQGGNNLHGAYGGIDKLAPYITIEPYALWRLQPGVKNEEGVIARLNEKVGGLRMAGKIPRGFDYGTEMVREFGSLATDKVQSWAGHWVVGHTFTRRFTPRVFGEYNFASGDHNPHDGIRATFDQLYPSGHDKYGFADQVGWRNIKDTRGGLETKLRPNVSGYLEYNDWYLASATDSLYNAAGTAVVRSVAGTAGTHVGQEFDATVTWVIYKPLTAGTGVGHIFPGEFLKNTTKGNPYTYPYAMVIWKF